MTPRTLIRSRSVALLIPLLLLAQAVVLGTYGWLVVALPACGVFLLVSQRITGRVVPFLALAMAVINFVHARLYMNGIPVNPAGSQFVVPVRDDLLMPDAAAFAAVGAGLYFWLGAPGAAWLVAAAGRLRERAGVSFLCLAAIVPVLVAGCELLVGLGHPSPVPGMTILLGVAILTVVPLVVIRPRAAVVMAIVILPLIGLDGIFIARHWPDVSDVGLYGVVLVDCEYAAMATGVQAGLFILAGGWLGWKYLQGASAWDGAAQTVALTQRVETLTRSRSDAVDSAAAELRRIERDLHDGAQARLVALGMNLRAAERVLKTDPDAALSLVSEARYVSSRALAELRDLVRGIYPPVLADRGLVDAIRALALDMPIHAVLDAGLPGRPELPVASAVYFSVSEALANVTRHAQARSVHIRIEYRAGMLRVDVTDDGVGGADPSRGTGLLGVERRLAAFDGIWR